MLRRFTLLLLLAPLAACSDTAGPGDDSARATADRTDPVSGAQVHVVYALPSDAADLGLDTTGVLEKSVGSFQAWMRSKTGGRELRLDRHEGKLDVTFVRLSRRDATMSAYGVFLRDSLESELRRRGAIRANKVYAVYYDGSSTYACGGAAWPPTVSGQIAAIYLKAVVFNTPCAGGGFVSSPTDFPGYLEFAMLHDLIHTFGVVSSNAPHHVADRPAHVPEPNDLMYSGSALWVIDERTVIDVGGDDYFGGSVPTGVVKLQDSPYLTAAPPATVPATASRVAGGGGGRSGDLVGLPFHPPLPTPR